MSLHAAPHFRICPACAADAWLGLASLFAVAAGCARHGVRYVEACACGERLSPFGEQEPFTYDSCGTGYSDLDRVPLGSAEERAAQSWEIVLEDLRRRPTATHTASDLREALRLVLHRAPERHPVSWQYKATDLPSLRHVFDVLRAHELSLDDFFRVIAEVQALRTSGAGAMLRAGGPVPSRGAEPDRAVRCPNPTCASERLWKQGFTKRSGRQYACRACATTFTATRVLFSYDPVPGIAAWRTRANEAKLEAQRAAVRAAAESLHGTRYLSVTRVFRAAGVSQSVRSYAPRTGLVAVIEEVARARGQLLKHPGQRLHPRSRIPQSGPRRGVRHADPGGAVRATRRWASGDLTRVGPFILCDKTMPPYLGAAPMADTAS